MAQIVKTILVDDLHGGPATDTVTFGLDGNTFRMDLNADNAALIRTQIGYWAAKAQRVSGASRNARAGALRSDPDVTAAARKWARDNGYDVADKGRLPGNIRAAFEAAGSPGVSRG